MARKRLTKGANALRVEDRIARVPADLAGPRAEGSGVFEALRLLERESEEGGGEPRRPPEPRPVAPRAKAEPERAGKPRQAAKAAAAPESGHEPRGKLGPGSFTKAERRAIVVSCTEYRNRLPTYLQSAAREVEILDSILRKCERADKDASEDA